MGRSFTTLFRPPATPEESQIAPVSTPWTLRWLRISWLCLSPLGLSFALRIAWEKTVWTVVRGPQMVGFSLMHIHPMFFLTGLLCCWFLMLWLVLAVIYMFAHKRIPLPDAIMVAVAIFVAVAMLTPDTFFAGR